MRIFLSMFAIVTFFFATPQTALAQSKCQTTLECAQLALDAAQASKEMIARLGLKGAVVSFNRASCPRGWEEYAPAYGRFVRGVDTSGSKATDPDGKRAPGNLQADAFKKHDHYAGPPQKTNLKTTSSPKEDQFQGNKQAFPFLLTLTNINIRLYTILMCIIG